MRVELLELLRCSRCGAPLDDRKAVGDGDLLSGELTCTACSAAYALRSGVPDFVPGLSAEVGQVQESYSSKWNRTPDIYADGTFMTRANQERYLTRFHWGSEEKFAEFLAGKQSILDAGTGLGRDVRWYAGLNPRAEVIGADLSESAYLAAERSKDYPNASFIQADLNALPFEPESLDFVACDQVLPCVADPRGAVAHLWSLVRPGGHFAFYAYRKKTPIHEFADDYLRDLVTKMSPDEAWEACAPLTELGKALSDLDVEFDLPSDIPFLGIKAGRYNLQRFVYYNVIKVFWNDNMTFDENNLVNFDWYHPAYTYRHTGDELAGWARELGMKVLVLDEDDPAGISVLVEKS